MNVFIDGVPMFEPIKITLLYYRLALTLPAFTFVLLFLIFYARFHSLPVIKLMLMLYIKKPARLNSIIISIYK